MSPAVAGSRKQGAITVPPGIRHLHRPGKRWPVARDRETRARLAADSPARRRGYRIYDADTSSDFQPEDWLCGNVGVPLPYRFSVYHLNSSMFYNRPDPLLFFGFSLHPPTLVFQLFSESDITTCSWVSLFYTLSRRSLFSENPYQNVSVGYTVGIIFI